MLKTRRRLRSELGLTCKQPGQHAYKRATVVKPGLPNRLNREFSVSRPDQAWCGDITYIWAGQRWSYLAVVLDLYPRRSVGWALSDKPDARKGIGDYLMGYYNRQRPHTFNDGMPPVVAEEKLKILSGVS